jgi:hypothetical protein
MKTILNQNIILLSKLEISLIKQKNNMGFQWRISTSTFNNNNYKLNTFTACPANNYKVNRGRASR